MSGNIINWGNLAKKGSNTVDTGRKMTADTADKVRASKTFREGVNMKNRGAEGLTGMDEEERREILGNTATNIKNFGMGFGNMLNEKRKNAQKTFKEGLNKYTEQGEELRNQQVAGRKTKKSRRNKRKSTRKTRKNKRKTKKSKKSKRKSRKSRRK